MPVSKHRRRDKLRVRPPAPLPAESRHGMMTLEELQAAVVNPARDFPAKVVLAGVWWFQELLRRVGDRPFKPTRKERQESAVLLCVAMDGEHGAADDLAPVMAAMLRPYCLAPSFCEAWERAHRLEPGTARALAARILHPPG